MAKILRICHFSALNLEKEYSREKITSAQPRMASTTDGVTDGGVEEDDGDEFDSSSASDSTSGPEVVADEDNAENDDGDEWEDIEDIEEMEEN